MKIYPQFLDHDLEAVFFKLSDDEIAPLKKRSNEILSLIKENNNDNLDPISYNKNLAGQIRHQYSLDDFCNRHIEQVLKPGLNEFITRYCGNAFLSLENLIIADYDKCWINFQKKYEYNPVHHHTGLFSFVIWIKIPYEMEQENKHETAIKKNSERENTNGDFHFILTNGKSSKTLKSIDLKVDNKWEHRGVLFDSSLPHVVYPFYTSDEYRISVSGNFRVK